MITFIRGLSLLQQVLGVVGIAAALFLGKTLYDNRQQAIGAEEVRSKIEEQDKKSIQQKAKNDAEIQNKPDADLVDELTRD